MRLGEPGLGSASVATGKTTVETAEARSPSQAKCGSGSGTGSLPILPLFLYYFSLFRLVSWAMSHHVSLASLELT